MMENHLSLDFKAMQKRYNRKYFKELREVYALIDCRQDYLDACWDWLYSKEKRQ